MRIGVLLSGCGYLDGSEIREAVITLLAVDRSDAQATIMAPDLDVGSTNHLTKQPMKEKRNILVEAARIPRGKIVDIQKIKADDLDALILPGGFGAAKHLSNFASHGANATVQGDVERLIKDVHRQGKPVGAICIAPSILATIFGKEGVQVTIGNDAETAQVLEQCGAKHHNRKAEEIEVDERLRMVTTPAYMYDDERLGNIATGIEKLVHRIIGMAKATRM
ncbi:MAG: isoprenoid biosynthesis glyoxalase ElbB [Bacteroidetes bacterium]|nr:isoprenoid biosynthesis glyoxalase ElbB [Bacteroidota bacterium]